jgi:hypothetical protein
VCGALDGDDVPKRRRVEVNRREGRRRVDEYCKEGR